MAKSKSPYRTRSSSTPPSKRSLDFTPTSVVSLPPSLSPDTSTDRVLTFLQSARDRNVPVRFGKWSREEELYLAKLITLFQDGILADMEPKMSLRTFLATMLNCCPMRISKKQMHGHSFAGKTKYQRKTTHMTQHEYQQQSHEVWTLRDAFLKAWAKEEYGRRGAQMQQDTSFQCWYDKVVELLPTPKLVRKSSWNECKKRPMESLEELKEQVQDDRKKQRRQLLVEIKPLVAQELETLDPVGMLPTPISQVTTPNENVVVALPTAYCSEQMNVGDWLTTSGRRADCQGGNHTGEARYTFCEDEVQVSVHLDDQQNSLSMTRRSSRLVIDFGAPSCRYTGEEPKRSPYSDYTQWTDNDLTEELAMVMEPGFFSWDDTSVAHTTYSPTLNFL